MKTFEYTFDFGRNPAFVIDAWFKKSIFPIGSLLVIGALLSVFSGYWFTRIVVPSIGTGAVIVFVGLYLYRRRLAIRRISNVNNTNFRYKIDDSGIHYDNEIGSGLIKWGFKGKLIPLKKIFLIQSPEMGLIPVPIDTPAEILTQIKDKLKAHKKR